MVVNYASHSPVLSLYSVLCLQEPDIKQLVHAIRNHGIELSPSSHLFHLQFFNDTESTANNALFNHAASDVSTIRPILLHP